MGQNLPDIIGHKYMGTKSPQHAWSYLGAKSPHNIIGCTGGQNPPRNFIGYAYGQYPPETYSVVGQNLPQIIGHKYMGTKSPHHIIGCSGGQNPPTILLFIHRDSIPLKFD